MYIRLNDSIILNRGYVKISDLSFATLDCLNPDHQHEGNWISPDGTTVDSSGSVPGFRTTRGPLIVRLLRTSGTPQQGIYQCVVQRATAVLYTVHVGLYNSGEGVFNLCGYGTGIYSLSTGCIQLSGGMTFTLDSDRQFTLTCISTGGPATTVTWTRGEYEYNITRRIVTVLDNPVTAQYTHTLNVTWKRTGRYACTVANEVFVNSTELDVEGKTECGVCYTSF